MAYVMKKHLANSGNYGSKRSTSNIKYIVIHYTSNDGDTDENNGKYFANSIVKASAHYFVDSDSVTQSVPDDYVAWSVGGAKYASCATTGGGRLHGTCTNSNSLSIEICDDVKNGVVYPSAATIENAIALTKELMKKYNVPADRVIRHFDVVGKICPAYWAGTAAKNELWLAEFWNKINTTSTSKITYRVRKTWADAKSQIGAYSNLENAKKACKSGYYVFDEQGKVVYPTTVVETPAKPVVVQPLVVASNVKDIQTYLNTYYADYIVKVIGAKLAVDGSAGPKTKKAIAIAFQVELNKLGAGLVIDGDFGSKSSAAFTSKVGTLKNGSKGIFVTLWQCTAVCFGYNPNGIDNIFGNGCKAATNKLFAAKGLSQDSVVNGADLAKIY